MSDYIGVAGWNKPLAVSNDLTLVIESWPQYQPRIDREDTAEWVLTANKKYSVKSTWNAIRRVGDTVDWYKVVWYKDAVPRCSFTVWLACKDRIRTRDKLKRWQMIKDSSCVLCGDAEETRGHLYFNCCFTQSIWRRVLSRNQQRYRCSSWQEEMDMAVRSYRGNSVAARIGRLALAVTAYRSWQERNPRIFQNVITNDDNALNDVQNYIIGRTWYWKVNRIYANW